MANEKMYGRILNVVGDGCCCVNDVRDVIGYTYGNISLACNDLVRAGRLVKTFKGCKVYFRKPLADSKLVEVKL